MLISTTIYIFEDPGAENIKINSAVREKRRNSDKTSSSFCLTQLEYATSKNIILRHNCWRLGLLYMQCAEVERLLFVVGVMCLLAMFAYCVAKRRKRKKNISSCNTLINK